MIRNGATEKVLSYLSTSDVLKLRNVSAGTWEGTKDQERSYEDDSWRLTAVTGYSTPENLQNYATYLDSRIRAYRDLKHDAIRVQSENNLDMRNSIAIGQDSLRYQDISPPNNTDKRRTIMGRKLRVMTVEKGLLRETRVVQKMINALVECRVHFLSFTCPDIPALTIHPVLSRQLR
jgi:phosphatidylinositol-binding clathrin assembly protein